jgi:hypothetical protein
MRALLFRNDTAASRDASFPVVVAPIHGVHDPASWNAASFLSDDASLAPVDDHSCRERDRSSEDHDPSAQDHAS